MNQINIKVIVVIILILGVLAGIVWFLSPDGQASVYVYPSDYSDTSLQEIKEQFASATDNRLNLVCNKKDLPVCSGTYYTDNLIQLFLYQNNLFKLAKEKNIDFSSITSGSFIATLFD